ncbi:F-box kelch-repeat At3g23880-like [Olea europaea subsp. europaea]|uniref:F-box kelch-repeat At3g23880-like n=1 Tax=Olea europaea subsp. europaea TaxID=158383 RepID=A0A8S0QF93_OLEEU|nr:F-box kelch-repeat At3g23880-like [Olea europaea subsp. europaea]
MAPKRRSQKLYLPEEVWVEILSRLPVKTLLRFKCVCRQWRTLISSPTFASLHLNRSISNPTRRSILVFDQYEDQFVSFDPVTFSPIKKFNAGLDRVNCFGSEIMCVGSTNGVLCIIDESGRIWLWNPSTRQYRKLPPGINDRSTFLSMGFGFDSVSNDYKVVILGFRYIREGEHGIWVEVWSSNLESWREIKVDYSFRRGISVCDVIVEGSVHWFVMDSSRGSRGRMLVASFDMRTELLGVIPLPESKHNYIFSGFNWNEKFALITCDNPQKYRRIYQVWTIESDSVGKESWSKKFTFELNVGSVAQYRSMLNTVNGKVVLDKGGKLMFYDVETRKMKTVGTHEDEFFPLGAYSYVESLLSIKGFSPLGEDGVNEN